MIADGEVIAGGKARDASPSFAGVCEVGRHLRHRQPHLQLRRPCLPCRG